MSPINGAHALLRTLTNGGVDTCFMNPGTSEMHFVAALDDEPGMRGVLALFEGVATGAADGYGRMAGRPAAVLLHLGPGLGNGLQNLHNARRAATPVVNIVGDHATYHTQYDAPLESDIHATASAVSGWYRRSMKTSELPADAAAALRAAMGPPGQVATLVLPADVSWSDGAEPARPEPAGAPADPSPDAVAAVAAAIRSGRPVGFLVGGQACREGALRQAGAIAAAHGIKLMSETFSARLQRGAGRVAPERLAYLAEMAVAQLEGLEHLVLVDAKSPVSFFAYPDKPSDLVPDGCQVHALARAGEDVEAALAALADELGVDRGAAPLAPAGRPDAPQSGPLTAETLGLAVGALLPEDAIVADEANTSGLFIAGATAGCPPHDWLMLTGGAIGLGLPLATGAAVACPDRKVLALEADGSAMYGIQALWTMAREGLDVTTVIVSNRSYAILNMELQRVGAGAGGPKAQAMLDLHRPDLDFVSLAVGMGVPATRAETAAELSAQLARALATPGPNLVEAVVTR
ncbi:MAG TPA: acetolactate synthase large subunit [Acidimicrobiales bacterium]|nr:acetolactate synthase large subunit [Acidimicrobiales bacterium]